MSESSETPTPTVKAWQLKSDYEKFDELPPKVRLRLTENKESPEKMIRWLWHFQAEYRKYFGKNFDCTNLMLDYIDREDK